MRRGQEEIDLFYHIAERLTPFAKGEQVTWHQVAAVVRPEELDKLHLPEGMLPPEVLYNLSKCRGCRLVIEEDRIWGELHIPAKAKQPQKSLAFVWWKSNVLFIDPSGIAATCMEKVQKMRPHHADQADDLMMDFFLALILDDITEMQSLEDRISVLEQAVLENRTEGFIRQMSALRKELNHRNRYYAQLNNLVLTIQESAADLLDACSQSRLQYVLRRLNRLQDEAHLLHEYASQVSSEYQAQVDIAQNRIMKLLTIVTTIFMPLSLIAGWYGMNFTNMPELDWAYGYPAVIALCVVVCGGCILYFRRKRYW